MSQVATETRAGYQVKRVQQLLRQACDEELRPTGLSMSQYAVLRALADHPGASSAELARLCFVTRQSLQDVLGGLRAADLVTVAERAGSGRARPVALTSTGRTRLRTAEGAVSVVEQRMLTGLAPREQQQLTALLTICAENLT
jgi:DNA-binding MarR family transcriptional regulator